MTGKRMRLAILGAFLICGGLIANATVFTFQPAEGSWHVLGNWDPPGTPYFGDQAIIPTGKTCVISAADANITILEIQSGGTVRVENRTLNVGGDGAAIVLNGQLEFRLTSSQLRLGPNVDMTGSGLLFTPPGGAHLVTIRPITGDQAKLTVGQGVTIRGWVTIRVHLRNDGLIYADAWDDQILVGAEPNQAVLQISGSGEFRAAGTPYGGGLLKFGRSRTDPVTPFTGLWRAVSGGELRLLQEAESGWTASVHNVSVNGGALRFEAAFATSRHLDFTSQGVIFLAYGKSAAFSVAGGQ